MVTSVAAPSAGPGPLASAAHRPGFQEVLSEPRPGRSEDLTDPAEDSYFVCSEDEYDPKLICEEQSYRDHVKAVRHLWGGQCQMWNLVQTTRPIRC